MKLKDFKVGQRVLNFGGANYMVGRVGVVTKAEPDLVLLDVVGLAYPFVVKQNPEHWRPTYEAQPEPAQENDWSYTEARRLQAAADAAIDQFNEYIKLKPSDVFIPKIK